MPDNPLSALRRRMPEDKLLLLVEGLDVVHLAAVALAGRKMFAASLLFGEHLFEPMVGAHYVCPFVL